MKRAYALKTLFYIVGLVVAVSAGQAVAQTNIALGGVDIDQSEAIEVTAENLTVDQETGRAIFTGDVIVAQGALRLTAQSIEVIYNAETGAISRLVAAGEVTLVTEADAAEADQADYNVENGTLELVGDVLLTQGASAISAENMLINLDDGSAILSGRVSTILRQDQN